jgi:gamma-glutamylaminecyclotransferase
MSAEHLVFVYGTLRRGEPNHRTLVRARFLREARTVPCFTLLDLGPFPGLVAGGTTAVVGEVYAVDELTLAALDHLEGHPRFYERREIALDDGDCVQGYVLPPPHGRRYPTVLSGDWCAHRMEKARCTSEL